MFGSPSWRSSPETKPSPSRLVQPSGRLPAGWSQRTARALCARLADLALVTLVPSTDGGAVTVHDVIRDFLRDDLGNTRLQHLHQVLLNIVAKGLPPLPHQQRRWRQGNAWRKLPESARYIRDQPHRAPDRCRTTRGSREVATDLRWIAARLEHADPAAPYTDLALIRSSAGAAATAACSVKLPTCSRPLTRRTRGSTSCAAELAMTRLGTSAATCRRSRAQPALVNRWPLPDSALRCVVPSLATPGR